MNRLKILLKIHFYRNLEEIQASTAILLYFTVVFLFRTSINCEMLFWKAVKRT